MKDAPLPDPGDCAVLPKGVYEYGQMGIGTCLSAPSDLAFLDDDRVLAVSNANAWKDFTGGSVTFLDLSTVDWTSGRNVIGPDASTHPDAEGVVARAVDMPSFSGAMTLAEPHDLLLVTNRLSEGERTREASDKVWFVDVSDPDAPDLAEIGPDGPYVESGWDPDAIHYDPSTDIAYVVNRTAHTVALLDMGADPVELVPPGGPTRLEAGDFDDADASGSTASFVELESTDEPEGSAQTWSLSWGVGTTRVWIPTAEGAYRFTGNGESLWTRSNVPLDLDLDDADEVAGIIAPHYLLESVDGYTYGRMFFRDDQGNFRSAFALDILEEWAWDEENTLLSPGTGWDTELGAPDVIQEGDAWYMFYDAGSGGEHAIGLATSVDGLAFSRADNEPVFAVDGVSLTDPFVIWDDQIDLWRMYYTVDGTEIGQATSWDLASWTASEVRFAPAAGASAPTVGYYNGKFHLFYTTGAGELAEATSIDGSDWTEVGVPFALDEGSLPEGGGVALQVSTEEEFLLTDQSGDAFATTLAPGDTVESTAWSLRVAVGQVADPDEVDMEGISLDSFVGETAYLTYTDADAVHSIGTGVRVGDDLVLAETPILEAGAGGQHDADGVYSPVVAEIGGELVMYYAAEAADVVTVGRATSTDGVTWVADAAPVLASVSDWDSVAIEPGSVQVLDDGTVRLWFTAFDGTNYRIGLAESTDGVTFEPVKGTQYDWVFDAGAPGDWYDSGVRHPWVVRDGEKDRMWFAGYSGETWALGYAERTGDNDEWTTAVDGDGADRAVLASGQGGFGAAGVVRPVVQADGDGWEVWYTGLDAELGAQGRIGRAVASDPDLLHRDMRMPTLADTWSFTSVPAREGATLSLDVDADGTAVFGKGCAAITEDTDRGFLYVGCKLVPDLFVIDIRDDSEGDFEDLNYLDVEAVIRLETSTLVDSGLRSLVVDRERGWLWGVADSPEAIFALDLAPIEDNAEVEIYREDVVSMLPLPRGDLSGDQGAETRSPVGPAQIAMHPDGHHLLVTNFNDNSVSAYDLSIGAGGTLVAQTEGVGENPYALRISSDGTLAAVGNYVGEVDEAVVSSTIALLDADPTSPTFLQVKTWLVNK